MVIHRTSVQNIYLQLVHRITSNSSNGRTFQAPLVKGNAGNKVTIIPFLRGGRRFEMK